MNLSNRKNPARRSRQFTDFANAKRDVKKKRVAKQTSSGLGLGFMKRSSEGKKKTTDSKKLLKKIGVIFSLTFLFGILFGILFLLGLVSAYSKNLPNIDEYFKQTNSDNQESIIVDRNGNELYRIRGESLKERVSINDVPEKLQWAFLAAEDAEFMNHKGVNLFGLTRAVVCTVKNKSNAGCGGGSSITQQLVKVTTGKADRSTERKVQEAILAMKVEQEYTKEEILEFYMNVVPEGGILNGVKAGSKYMYGEEDLHKLSLAQMAYLAAIPNAPSMLSPWGGSNYNPERSRDRAAYVLDRMLELKDRTGVTEDEIKQAKEELSKVVFKTTDVNKKAPHYVDYVIKELNQIYADKVGEGEEGYRYLKDKGYTIVTAVDLETQMLLESTLRTQVLSADYQKYVGSQNAAAVMMDPKTGEIIAMVGSRDFYGDHTDERFSPQANAALFPRSEGSTMKPILYMTAFMNGYNPSSIVPDIPLDLRPNGSSQSYPVKNYEGGKYSQFGPFISMRVALQRSLNVPAVSTIHYVGEKQYEDTYKKLSGWDGFKVQGPSAPLGSANIPLLEQVHAYSTLASEGVYHPKKVILEIKDKQNKVVFDNRNVESKQVVEKKYTFLINDMNKRYWLFSGFSYSDPLLVKIGQSMDIAGKTGTADSTANGVGDVAFIGYTPTFALGMWAGNSCAASKCPINPGATGENLYKYLYKPFLEQYWTKIQPARWYTGNNLPDGVRRVEVCSLTGKLKSDQCLQAGGQIISEYVADTSMPGPEDMIEQKSVTMCSDVEKLARQIDKDLGLAQTKTYVAYQKLFKSKFISDQIASYLQKNGKLPPTEECNVQRNVQNTSITIVSPVANSSYSPGQNVQVTATVSGDIPIRKVEVFDTSNQLVATYDKAPYAVSTVIKAPNNPGTYKVIIIATDAKGEIRQETSFTVDNPAPTPTVNITVTPTQVNAPSAVSLNASLQNYTGPVNSAKFVVTGSSSGNQPILNANQTGTKLTGSFSATLKDTYTIEATFVTNSGTFKNTTSITAK